MRRLIAATAGLALTLALPGCARPAGVDGDLVDDWPPMPRAQTPVPVVGVCYAEAYTAVWSGDFDPVDCRTRPHKTETGYVGAVTGTAAASATPPGLDSPAMVDAYDRCQRGASAYLGGDWHTAIVGLGLVLPDAAAWTGGARWFRCDLVHYTDPDSTAIVPRGTLRGDLAGPRTAGYGCLAVTTDRDRTRVLSPKPVDCARPHAAEFAGTLTAPAGPWPADDATRQQMLRQGCKAVVAAFLGYAGPGEWHNTQLGWWELGWEETQWKLGDRTTQCFAFAYTRSGTVVGSVRGIRDRAPQG